MNINTHQIREEWKILHTTLILPPVIVVGGRGNRIWAASGDKIKRG
jgi:hypothetical protein